MSRYSLTLSCLVACILSMRCIVATGTETQTVSQESCASCGLRAPDQSERMDIDFLEAVKRHILNRLQMRERPNITHPIPKAAMVTALRRLHAGKVREDGRVEIPNFDGQAAYSNDVQEETSEIISFAESGDYQQLQTSHLVHSRAVRLCCLASCTRWIGESWSNMFNNQMYESYFFLDLVMS